MNNRAATGLVSVGLLLFVVLCVWLERSSKHGWEQVCDAERRTAAFEACLDKAKNVANITAAGNVSDEIIEACDRAARNTWCHSEWKCQINCN